MARTVSDVKAATIAIETESDARLHLAACYRLMAHYGLDDTIYTHISARVPGEPGHFLINPFGLGFDEILPEDLVKLDFAGTVVGPSRYPANAAGFVIHSAVLAARPDVHCVVHAHTRAGVALSCLEEGLLPMNQFSLEFLGRVAMHDYEGIALDLDEREVLVRDLGDKPVMLMRNHGTLVAGASIPGAFYLTYYLEQACRVQMDVLASGRPYVLPPEAIQRHTATQYSSAMDPASTGQRMWPSMLRKLDRVAPGWHGGINRPL